MACRGVHFAITDDDLAALRAAGSDDDVMEVVERIEKRWEEDAGFVCETDKAWDAIHRCLTGGSLEFGAGPLPLRLCILGGEQLHEGEGYIVSLVRHDQLPALIESLRDVTPEFMTKRYAQLPDDYAEPKSDEDCQYTWDWFSDLPAFFERAAKAGRHVIFSVDQ
jgi:hypothetical protein